MCSIMGYCSSGVAFDIFKKGFDKTVSRGPDDSKIVDTGKGLLGFHRLAIMGLHPEGMQPFEMDGSYVVCNGEIYGFEKIRQALQEKGLLQSPGAKGRKRALVTGARPGQIPVVGVVTAGLPILAVENQEGTLPWNDPGCFALRVRGDSMLGAGILPGDKVVVRPQATADDGQIVVARLEDEATVKRLRRRGGEIWLMPENDAYAPIDGTHAEIIGVVKAVVREY